MKFTWQFPVWTLNIKFHWDPLRLNTRSGTDTSFHVLHAKNTYNICVNFVRVGLGLMHKVIFCLTFLIWVLRKWLARSGSDLFWVSVLELCRNSWSVTWPYFGLDDQGSIPDRGRAFLFADALKPALGLIQAHAYRYRVSFSGLQRKEVNIA
jgi:hypothetical protein